MKRIFTLLLALLFIISLLPAVYAEEIELLEISDHSGDFGDDDDDDEEDGPLLDPSTGYVLSDLSYKCTVGKPMPIADGDLINGFENMSGGRFDHIIFPAVPSSTDGTLYIGYNTSYQTKVQARKVYTEEDLADMSFVPKRACTVTVSYKMYDMNERTEGYGNIKFTATGGTPSSVSSVSYSCKSTGKATFVSEDFNTICRREIGDELDYVTFTLPSSSYGALYYAYDSKLEEKVTKGTPYYAVYDPFISGVSFVPKSSYSGTVTISYTGYTEGGDSFTGSVKVKVTASSTQPDDDDVDTISYTGTNSGKIAFDVDDFYDVCDDATGKDLYKITFPSLPSTSYGTLYLGYKSSSKYEDKVTKNEEYYPDDDPCIDDISFVPKSSYTGTVKITYRGYYSSSKYYTGEISIKVKAGATTDDDDDYTVANITLSASTNEVIDMNDSSIASAFKKASGKTLSYVKFTLPSSSYGTLYYDYDGKSQEKVSASTKYYYSSSKYLRDVSFVPAKNYSGTVTLNYTAYATSGSGYTGKIKITYSGSSSKVATDTSLTYKTKGEAVHLSVGDFNNISIKNFDSPVSWVKLGMVGASYGKLRYKDQSDVQANTTIYPAKAPMIDDVAFLPTAGYTGDVSLTYSAQSDDGDSFSGTIHFTVESAPKPQKRFRDVSEGSWYYENVYTVCDAGLMKGNSEDTFNPDGNMSLAEAITMGARLHRQNAGGSDADFIPTGGNWYDVYVSYAITNGIIPADLFTDYGREATRAEMAYIFFHSVSLTQLAKINNSTVPDVSRTDRFATEIYALYDAGILTGSDAAGTFRAESNINRAEAATILGRTKSIIPRVQR